MGQMFFWSKKHVFQTLNIKRSIKAIAILLKGLSTLIIVAYNICIHSNMMTFGYSWTYHELLDRGVTINEDTIDDIDDDEIILDSCILAIFY